MSTTSQPRTPFLTLPHELRNMILLPNYDIKALFITTPPYNKVYVMHYCRTKEMDRWAAVLKKVNPEIETNVDSALGEWTERFWESFNEWKEVGEVKGWEKWMRDGVDGSNLGLVEERKAENEEGV